jgi:transmembrane sensor
VSIRQADSVSMEQEASDTFVQRLHGEWTRADQAAFESRLAGDPGYADAYRRVQESWASLDAHAESPEIMRYREEAIATARRTSAGRWLKPPVSAGSGRRIAAALAGIALLLGVAWQLSPFGYVRGLYSTGVGEQRIVDLEDHSRIALDAATRLRVRFSRDARVVELWEGQAQFSVAKDATRPFKVEAGGRTVVAVGTVFTVEYVDQKVNVTMMEGKVTILPTGAPDAAFAAAGGGDGISLIAGEALQVSRDGHTTLTPKADLEAATAWREGKLIIRTESLGEVVHRMNRYSPLQIRINDEALAAKRVSGVFETGDTSGFVNAIRRYLPVVVEQVDSNTVELRLK